MRRRFRHMQRAWAEGEIEWDEVQQRINSWVGHSQWGDTRRLREQMFDQFGFPLRSLPPPTKT